MKTIYILTYHCASNVGAMLQCFALSSMIEKMGFTPKVIDFRPSKVISPSVDFLYRRKKRKSKIDRVKVVFKYYLKFLFRVLRYGWDKKKHYLIYKGYTSSAFCDFMTKNFHLTDNAFYNYEDLEVLSYSKDVFIVGSDQVWNPILSDVPKAYLLDFVKQGKKNSYGASFGSATINEDFSKQLRNSLSDFQIISVREDSGINIVRQYANKSATCVLDPVFLLGKNDWEKLIYKVPLYEPYIFVYRTEDNALFQKEIEKLRFDNPKLKVVQFDYIEGGIDSDYIIQRKGPIDFLSYLFASNFVVTNSFHGTAFSIIAKKKAVIIPHSCYNERMESLMNKTGIEKNNEGIYYMNDCNIDILLGKHIEFSLGVLRNICSE